MSSALAIYKSCQDLALIRRSRGNQTPKVIQKLDPLEPKWKLYRGYVGVVMGLYRGCYS